MWPASSVASNLPPAMASAVASNLPAGWLGPRVSFSPDDDVLGLGAVSVVTTPEPAISKDFIDFEFSLGGSATMLPADELLASAATMLGLKRAAAANCAHQQSPSSKPSASPAAKPASSSSRAANSAAARSLKLLLQRNSTAPSPMESSSFLQVATNCFDPSLVLLVPSPSPWRQPSSRVAGATSIGVLRLAVHCRSGCAVAVAVGGRANREPQGRQEGQLWHMGHLYKGI